MGEVEDERRECERKKDKMKRRKREVGRGGGGVRRDRGRRGGKGDRI